MIKKIKKNVSELFLIYDFKHVFFFFLLLIISNLQTSFSYYEDLNFWSILFSTVTNSLHYAFLIFLIIFIVIDICRKMKSEFIMIRNENYVNHLKSSLFKIILCVLFALIFSLFYNIIISCIRSKFNFSIITLAYYDIPIFVYLLIHFLKVLFIFIMMTTVIFYFYNLINNKNKVFLIVLFLIPVCCLITNQGKLINDILNIPLLYSSYLTFTPFSNIFLEISGYIIQLFIFSFIIIILENKIFNGKGDIF